MKGVFDNINDGQKSCILLLDEVYVKPMLTYHGGNTFGHAVNASSSLAKTVLDFMVVCLYGGPKFLVKMLPVSKLDSDFLLNIQQIMEKWNINTAKLIFQKATEEPRFNDAICGHYCDKCNYKMAEEHCELFDNLNELEKKSDR